MAATQRANAQSDLVFQLDLVGARIVAVLVEFVLGSGNQPPVVFGLNQFEQDRFVTLRIHAGNVVELDFKFRRGLGDW